MTGTFFNRETEIAQISQIFSTFSPEYINVLWIEGEPGVGKSILMEKVLNSIVEKDLLFEYDDGRKFHKCNDGDEEMDFSMLSPLLNTLERKRSDEFREIVARYLNNFAAISLRESLLLSIPGIKGFGWMTPLFKVAQNHRVHIQRNISDNIIKSHLVSLFVTLITTILPKIYSSFLIVLAIDDIAWIDSLSFRVILSSTEKLRKFGISLSYIVTSRDYSSISNQERFWAVERGMLNIADENKHFYLQLDNLGVEKTKEYFYFCGKPEFENRLDFIFRETQGNFLKLFQTIKCSTERLERLYAKSLNERSGDKPIKRDIFSQDHIKIVMRRSPRTRIILSVITALRNSVTVDELHSIVTAVCNIIYKQFFSVDEINTSIDELRNEGLVSKAGNYTFCHDHILDQVRSVVIQMGEQKKIWNAILSTLVSSDRAILHFPFPRNLVLAIDIADQISRKKALAIYVEHLPILSASGNIPKDFLRLGAKALSARCSKVSSNILNTVAVQTLRLLVLAPLYQDAIDLADQIYKRFEDIEQNSLFSFLFSFLTSMRECDVLLRTNNVSAREIADKLLNLSNLKPYQRAKALLLYCSILEYFGEFDDIVKIYSDLPGIIKSIGDDDDRRHAQAVYCRNAGLAYFHGDISRIYEEGVELAKQLKERPEHEKVVLIGTTLNNLGLGYLYNREIEKAIGTFKNSCRQLELVQYGTECPNNNLALCYFLKKDINTALEYIRKARQFPPGPYQKLGMDINHSVILWKMGYRDKAIDIVAPIAKGEDLNHTVTAVVIQAHAAMTYAYFLMEKELFWEAAKYYQESILDRFRIQDEIEKRRRNALMNYCLAKVGAKAGQDLGDLSILDDSNDEFFDRSYDFVTLALYIN